ncbi:MAG: MotA/TolQ/ExbB proton channel family protein [Deltaproteobacteria bacterium]|nr:MotA/TolQ/ExbB proton channel family protein [Deltaproteobacteria bacterium]
MLSKIQQFIHHGGPFFIINCLCLAVVIAVIVERAIYFLGRGHINAKAFLEQIKRLLAANNVDRAKKLCDATTAPVARVAKAGLSRANKGEAAVAQAIEETMVDVTPEIKKRIGSLWSLANIATLVGLLGTITGLIATFEAVAHATPAERQARLSAGISEAMFNTAMGLFIAVVCMVAHLLLSAAAKKVVGDLESFSLRLENMLGEGTGGASAAGAHAAPASDER